MNLIIRFGRFFLHDFRHFNSFLLMKSVQESSQFHSEVILLQFKNVENGNE